VGSVWVRCWFALDAVWVSHHERTKQEPTAIGQQKPVGLPNRVADYNRQQGAKENTPHADASRVIGGGMTKRGKGAFYTNEC